MSKNGDVAAQEVQNKVNLIVPQLPQTAKQPIVQKFDPDAAPILQIAVSAKRSLRDVTLIADKQIKQKLENAKGVGQITIVGGARREIHVDVDPDRLRSYSLTINDVFNALRAQNLELPGGNLNAGARELTVRTTGRIVDSAQFNQITVATRNGYVVKVSDIGKAEDSYQEPRSAARLDGVPAVTLIVAKQSGMNTVTTADEVKQRLKEISAVLPPDVKAQVISDQSVFIKAAVDNIKRHLIEGSIFASIIIFLFLANIRTTLIAAVAIPTSRRSARDGSGGVRIAELVATLSYAADLGLGQPMEHCLRQTVIALRLADLAGATERDREATFYLGLLMNAHCHADATEQAAWFGDDIAFKGEGVETLGMNTAQIDRVLRAPGRLARQRRGAGEAARDVPGRRAAAGGRFMTTHSTLGAQFAERIGLDAGGLARGRPGVRAVGRQGAAAPAARRADRPAGAAGAAGRRRSRCSAVGTACRRRWRWLAGTAAPSSTRRWSTCSATHAAELLDGLDQAASWDAVLERRAAAVAPRRRRRPRRACSRRWRTSST